MAREIKIEICGTDALIHLTRGHVAAIDAADLDYRFSYSCGESIRHEVVGGIAWRSHVDKTGNAYAITTRFAGKDGCRGFTRLWLHKVLVGAGVGQMVDHKDGNTLNDRRTNLRHCTAKQNARNARSRRGVSRFRGVRLASPPSITRPWRAQIHFTDQGRKQMKFLGNFATEEEAALAYDSAANRLFGEFARTNFSLANLNAPPPYQSPAWDWTVCGF